MENYVILSRSALVSAAASGRVIWCLETGEGFQWDAGSCSKRHIRHMLAWLLRDGPRCTFAVAKDD